MSYLLMSVPWPAKNPGHRLTLPAGEVHVWSACLDQSPPCVARLEAILSREERQRATRFRFERDRRGFVVARGVLRCLLAALLGDEPGQIQFQYGIRGKPELAGRHGRALFFNVSHSHELGLLAFARWWPIGVDVEHRRPIPDLELLAASVLADQEYVVYSSLPPSEKVTAFLTAWTCKEAVMKALGQGFSCSPRAIVVSVTPGQPAALHALGEDSGSASGWSLRDVPVPPDYVAALAVRARGWRLVTRRWPQGADTTTE